ncbi:DUF1571 domain-containing protein [Stieleria varia]|uniref:DUF1571 domain-containing protein n=1 Tax=Stieleria varia TaxID=2528005 RepID=A0A5C6BAW7_9BACT|nr:DUF1571 domain-containing protein [Stieleria varia]TWU08419.1 hypothetical protein Pla52n_10020 [Stieleria varia]
MCQRPTRYHWLLVFCAALLAPAGSAAEPSSTQKHQADDDRASSDLSCFEDLQVAGECIGKCRIDEIHSELSTAYDDYQNDVKDYTALLIKREKLGGKLSPRQFAKIKVREPKQTDEGSEVPLSVYMKFYRPQTLAGREILFVEDQRDGLMLARKGGMVFANYTQALPTDHPFAKAESNYLVTDTCVNIMFQTALDQLRCHANSADCELSEFERKSIKGKHCRHFELRLHKKADDVPYHFVRFMVDAELRLPIYVATYGWETDASHQTKSGKESEANLDRTLLEEFFLAGLKINVGLGDEDFEADHPDYQFSADPKLAMQD